MPLSSVPAFLNLILGYEYYKPVNRKPHVKAPFMPSSAPSARHITIPTDPKQDPLLKVCCGQCNEPAYAHPVIDLIETAFGIEEDVICDREPSDILNVLTASDWLDTADYDTRTGMSVVDADGSNAYLERGSDLDAYEYDTLTGPSMWEAVDRYRDSHPTEVTAALNAWTNAGVIYTYRPDSAQAIGNLPGRYLDADQSKNIYFAHEDNHQGITVEYYNDHLTELYAHRLLNFYVDKRTGDLRLGGLRLAKDSATCVRNNCKAHLVKPDTEDRNEQEQYVLDLIRHGNNHAANFLVSRSDWYKVHTDFCDLNCDRNAAHCGTIDEVVARSLELLRSTLNTSPLKVA